MEQLGSLRIRNVIHERRARLSDSSFPPEPENGPEQLELFAPRCELLFPNTAQASEALLQALLRGDVVGMLRATRGFALLVAERCHPSGQLQFEGHDMSLGPTCGFTRRVEGRLIETLERDQRAIWARPAAPRWNGWIEWGMLLQGPTASGDPRETVFPQFTRI